MEVKRRGPRRNITHTIGTWSWDEALFLNKIDKPEPTEANPSPCHTWKGSTGPYGGLFGALRNGAPQMTQARRIAYMMATGHNIEDKGIYAYACMNPNCVNPTHLEARPNRRLGLR
jgi:hypothetical protein